MTRTLARRDALHEEHRLPLRALREGRDIASETRRRRLGERLWALVVLEAWCRRFIDRKALS